jgi:hypothetical protein
MRRTSLLGISVILALAVPGLAQKASGEKVCYRKPTPTGTALECTFTLRRSDDGWTIQSRTDRDATTHLDLTARYDAANALTHAEAVLTTGDKKQTALVEVQDGKARVKREGKAVQEFQVPKGVIVTSMPDWTDTWFLCRRYDRTKAGKQEFAGLWIHPVQPAMLLTFTVERLGAETITHDGKKIELDRVSIHLRNNNPYVAWVDEKGRMVKLMALPVRVGSSVLLLEGYEKSVAGLQPAKP